MKWSWLIGFHRRGLTSSVLFVAIGLDLSVRLVFLSLTLALSLACPLALLPSLLPPFLLLVIHPTCHELDNLLTHPFNRCTLHVRRNGDYTTPNTKRTVNMLTSNYYSAHLLDPSSLVESREHDLNNHWTNRRHLLCYVPAVRTGTVDTGSVLLNLWSVT